MISIWIPKSNGFLSLQMKHMFHSMMSPGVCLFTMTSKHNITIPYYNCQEKLDFFFFFFWLFDSCLVGFNEKYRAYLNFNDKPDLTIGMSYHLPASLFNSNMCLCYSNVLFSSPANQFIVILLCDGL